jgi:hypothetical protein
MLGAVSLGLRCVVWLIETVEEVLRLIRVEEFVRSIRKASNVVTTRVEVTWPIVFWRWRFKVRGAEEGLSCCRNVVKGEDGIDSLGS